MEESFGLEDYSGAEPRSQVSVDPVCGMSVDESKAAGRTGYAGQMYYFCLFLLCRVSAQFRAGPRALCSEIGRYPALV